MNVQPAASPRPRAAGTLSAPARARPAVIRRSGERIIVGVDDSPGGLAALRWAVAQSRSGHAELVAVRAWALGLPRHGGRRRRGGRHQRMVVAFDGAEQRAAAAALIRQAFRLVSGGVPAGPAVRFATPEGDPGPALTALARREGDVLVVGRRPGHPAMRAVHGSVSRYCSTHSSCPVFVVPPGAEPGGGTAG
jgi:nucleotide-binding universal stress UspA family protein